MTTVPENCDGPHPRGLTQRFGIRTAVDNVELLVSRGCEVGYAGPNGSVKTTLIRVLPGLTRAARGTISLLGIPVRSRRSLALARVSAIAGESRFHGHLTEPENLKMLAVGHGRGPRQDRPGAGQDGAGPGARRQGLRLTAPEEGRTNHSSRVIRQPRRARPPTARTAAAVLATVGVLLAAACSGSPSSTGSGGSPNAGGEAHSPSMLAYSRCVRSRGVPGFPDPDSSGNINKTVLRQLGVSDSVLKAATYACRNLNPYQ